MKIPEPRKLKSGSYFIQLRLSGVSVPVTASTAKECKQQAALIKAEHRAGTRKIVSANLTLAELIQRYVDKYESVLSPATTRGYMSIKKNRFPNYMSKPVKDIRDWQTMINEELKTKSEKTVANGWGAITAALGDAGIPVPDVKLADVPEQDLAFLEPEEIPLFLEAARGDPCEIEMLLELHGLRESEAMYVVQNNMIDVKHNVINVRGAIVPNKDNKYVEKKTNKTKSSTRSVPIMIPRLAELVKEYEDAGKPIPTHSPSALLSHVHKTCERAGVTDCTNHDLRRTCASLGYSLGVSERVMMDMCGWEDPQTMHKIYVKLAARDKAKANNAMADFYASKDYLLTAELQELIEKYSLKSVKAALSKIEKR